MTAGRDHDLGKVVFSRRAGLDGVVEGISLLSVAGVLNFALQATLFDVYRLLDSTWLTILHFVAFPSLVVALLSTLPRIEYRERGVRWWWWSRGWSTWPVGPETTVAYRFNMPGEKTKGGRRCLLLYSGPRDRDPAVLGSRRLRDDPRLLEVALRYARHHADLMLRQIREGVGAVWVSGVRLDPDGVRGPAARGGPRVLIPYARIRDYRVTEDRFRIEAGDGAVIEGDTWRVNFLSGQIALQEIIGSGSV